MPSFPLSLALMVGALTVPNSPAVAGVLSKVVHGMKQRAAPAPPPAAGEPSSDADASNASNAPGASSPSDYGHRTHLAASGTSGANLFHSGAPFPIGTHGNDTQLYVGLQSVKGSSGSASMSFRSSYNDFGFEVDNTRYYERIKTAQGPATLTLDAWSTALVYRVVQPGQGARTAVWLRGGVAGASAEGLQVLGATVGATIAHNVRSSSLGLQASGRLLVYQDDIRGVEARAGLAASVLRVSYRILKYNVGPALQGPEVGAALRF